MIARAFIGLSFAVVVWLGSAGRALATDDYTLPFYDPAISLSYGVDRDPRSCYQRDWANVLWADCNLHYGRVYDGHTGMDYPMPVVSPIAASRDGTVIDLFEGFGTEQFGINGNYVLVSHADGRRTLYYHLAQNGARVAVGQAVLAGQWIADSGCSGQCYGAHLHFEMRAVVGGRRTAAAGERHRRPARGAAGRGDFARDRRPHRRRQGQYRGGDQALRCGRRDRPFGRSPR